MCDLNKNVTFNQFNRTNISFNSKFNQLEADEYVYNIHKKRFEKTETSTTAPNFPTVEYLLDTVGQLRTNIILAGFV